MVKKDDDEKRRKHPPSSAVHPDRSRRVESVFFCGLFISMICIFARLRTQRRNLPHAMRVNDFIEPPPRNVFHIVHILADDLGYAFPSFASE